MKIVDITLDNVEAYQDYLGEDMAENIGRSYYRGIAMHEMGEEEPCAGMVWQLRHMEDEEDIESDIEWLQINDRDYASELLTEYGERIESEYVAKSKVVIPVKDHAMEKEVLKEAGFNVRLTEGDHVRLELSELLAHPVIAKGKIPETIRPINELTPRKFRAGIIRCLGMGRRGICEDLQDLPMSFFENEVSIFSEKNSKINGFLLFHWKPSGVIAIQLMVALDADYGKTLPGMMRRFVQCAKERYPEDTKILVNRHNEASLSLSEKLFPRSFGIPVYAGEREEHSSFKWDF